MNNHSPLDGYAVLTLLTILCVGINLMPWWLAYSEYKDKRKPPAKVYAVSAVVLNLFTIFLYCRIIHKYALYFGIF